MNHILVWIDRTNLISSNSMEPERKPEVESTKTTSSVVDANQTKEEVLPLLGRCGLLNKGNTCYMNTGIQVCLKCSFYDG